LENHKKQCPEGKPETPYPSSRMETLRCVLAAHVCNLNYSGGEIRRIVVPGQPRKKVQETPISTNSWVGCGVPVIPAIVGRIKQQDFCPGWLGQKAKLCFQNNHSKKKRKKQ
jgi:hypothetical protein